jgi:7-cyano-7-deazaguanine synthase
MRNATAVLFSAGLDSAVLVADEATRAVVYPLYVSVGLAWEEAELATASRFLQSHTLGGQVRPLTILRFSMTDVYPPSHWAIRGTPPAYDTPDEDVYLTGRNVVLLAKAGTWCAQHGIRRIVLGPLAGNPFPDATPAFFAKMADALSVGLAHPLDVATPFRELHKEDVIALGTELSVPFELTLSCMNPQPAAGDGNPAGGGRTAGADVRGVPYLHCGVCSKCRERRNAFRGAGRNDPAPYANNELRATSDEL